VNPEAFLQLDRVIHERGRLAIMSLLAATPQMSFKELRTTLQMTDGNLTTHMRTLQEAGYVSVTKEFRGGRPWTTYALTTEGRRAFAEYLKVLERVLEQAKGKEP